MTVLIVLIAATLVGYARSDVVELSCGDNATCIDSMTRELVRSLRAQKSVRLFDVLTIDPVVRQESKSYQGPVARFLQSHAFGFDIRNWSFRFSKSDKMSNAMDLEIFEGRSATKEEVDDEPKKSNSKVEGEDKKPKPKLGLRRRQKRKVLQAIVPLLFGMKSAASVLFAMAVVTVLTLKAFVASKLALGVTLGMAAKKLYDSYALGLPETSNVLWSIARYIKLLFGFGLPPLNPEQSMTMPMYVVPEMYAGQMGNNMIPMAQMAPMAMARA